MGACLSIAIAGGLPEATVLFFPDAAMPCRSVLRGHICNRPNCNYAHSGSSLMVLLAELDAATRSIDVCVFTITCNKIADALVAAGKRGVRVRIITDGEQGASNGSDVARLAASAGIKLRRDKDPSSHMHHKFAVVDNAILINGSFNWTRGAVLSNHENVVISRRVPFVIASFNQRFEHMWGLFAGN